MSETKEELLNRKRPDEPLKFWIRERPAGSRGDKVDHWKIFYGPRGCSYGQLPFEIEHWEVARALANALVANLPTEEQINSHITGR